MVERFEYRLKQLISKQEKVLLAVSGGMDSMAMSHLFQQLDYDFALAHCNFQLRNKESDADEQMILNYAKKQGLSVFNIQFDTLKIQKERGGSIQQIARDLRYEWLEKIRIENDYDYIATAHHLNDSIETFLYNFTKGTGISGLRGIDVKRNHIIRPLSHFSKEDIKNYINNKNISYREDASNSSNKYHRNLIRNQVVPVLKEVNPSLEKTALKTFENLKETEILLHYFINEIENNIIDNKNNIIHIHIKKLKKYPATATIIFEILKKYNFNPYQIQDIVSIIDAQAGKYLDSSTHRLLKDRTSLIIAPLEKDDFKSIYIHENDNRIDLKNGKTLSISTNLNKEGTFTHALAIEKLEFPLLLRRWKAGDYFHPKGMNGKSKKIKKFLTDLKINRIEKEEVMVIESAGKICCVIGFRDDERFGGDGFYITLKN